MSLISATIYTHPSSFESPRIQVSFANS